MAPDIKMSSHSLLYMYYESQALPFTMGARLYRQRFRADYQEDQESFADIRQKWFELKGQCQSV